jgi:predicted phosphodiesterase
MKKKVYIVLAISLLILAIVILMITLYWPAIFGQSLLYKEQFPPEPTLRPLISIVPDPTPTPEALVIGENWRYVKGNQEPPPDWKDPGFDDSEWSLGKPGFGYGDLDDRTTLEDMKGNYLSLYLRNVFYLSALEDLAPIYLSIDYDDSYVLYINGIETARKNIKGDPPPYDKTANDKTNTGLPEIIYINPEDLNSGPNVIAIQAHNVSLRDGGFSLIPFLMQSQVPIELGELWRYSIGKYEPPSNWNQVEFDDSDWRSGITGFGFGDGDDATKIKELKGNYLSLYTRSTFYVADPDQLNLLRLKVDYDDGFVAYLNGTEVLRKNLSGNPPQFNSAADKVQEAGNPASIIINPALLQRGKNVLAIQVHNSKYSDPDLTLKPSLWKSGPYLQNVTQGSFTVMWESSGEPSSSKVRFRRQGDLIWKEIVDSGTTNIHEIEINGLSPDTMYEYQISQGDIQNWIPGNPAPFSTSPYENGEYRIAFYGDSRTYPENHSAVVQSIINNKADLVLHAGDLVDEGRNYEVWGDQFFGPLADLMVNTPTFPVLGNHEFDGSGRLWYFDLFSLPGNESWFAFDYGCTRIIGLDSNNDFTPGSEQYLWFIDELESQAFQESSWQLVYLHHPPYTSGPHPHDEVPVVEHLVPLFKDYGVDFVLAGHNHHYERTYKDGTYYIVSGGGGAELYDFPLTKLNPDSQVRKQILHHVTIDFICPEKRAELSAWNTWNNRIDGPIQINQEN